ncbi:hypothetical protein AcV5_007273 [Taiwanofungus camphoratus]|nr:hypothetical protein AcV5_007273 [Antrodia cinnamomea]
MLQYPVQLPPLSLTSSKRSPLVRRGTSDDHHDAPLRGSLIKRAVVNDKLAVHTRPSHHIIPLSISPAFSPDSSPSSSPPSTPFLASKQTPRSPLVSSPRQLPSPVYRPSLSPRSRLPSLDGRSSRRSSVSSTVMDVLAAGDLVGEGLSLQGEPIARVPMSASDPRTDYDGLAAEFEVVRRLGTGSYAVVYLVREVLSRPAPSDDGHCAAVGRMDFDDAVSARQSTEYGREYAIKLLSKANLDEDALAAQLFEATIHQSLPAHPNIVTLHRTLETPSFLLLLLEFVPGEDLFYFLEQARDHYEADPESDSPSSDSSCVSRTPPTPSLLSSLNPAQLLSRTRLRLIASMFSQMCEAVAACHDHSVFHRDIKPENFIVTDGWTTLADGRRERKVIVKLTDFGLSTTDTDSADMDCGSAPYMSFECRNNIHPTYSPRAADVWSLGIVLINMLYHYNPWTDTTQGVCSSFETFRLQPVHFFMQRFAGMSLPVAEFLANKVFCLLDDPKDDSKRIGARAFGAWVRDLPALLGGHTPGHARNISISSIQGHRLSSIPHSRRPSLRCATPVDPTQRVSRSMSRAPSLGPAYEEPESMVLAPVPDQENEEQEQEVGLEVETESRSTSTYKRRKRGARKGKGALASPVAAPDEVHDTLDTLAEASQALAREISRTSRTSSLAVSPIEVPPPPISTLSPSVPTPTISKKPSKWLRFGKGTGGKVSAAEEVPSEAGNAKPMSSTASNVTNLLMSLNAPPPSTPRMPTSASQPDGEESWARGRRPKGSPYSYNAGNSATWGPSAGSPFSSSSHIRTYNTDKRGVSPTSTRSGRPLASSASSTASSNWRSSMSSAGTSTSAFTRYSNSSTRSVSTAATSVSSNSWRSQSNKYPYDNKPAQMPANVKFVTGTPWELYQLPRQMYPNPDAVQYSGPPVRNKRRGPKPKDPALDTISERPYQKPVAQRMDAMTSTTDLDRDGSESREGDHDGSPRKVQKGQINALAKMLSALRR